MGSPIRKSTDQSLFAAPHGLSQRTTSFIASQRQGIHQIPLLHLITLIIDAHTLIRTCSHRWIIRKTSYIHEFCSTIHRLTTIPTGPYPLRNTDPAIEQTFSSRCQINTPQEDRRPSRAKPSYGRAGNHRGSHFSEEMVEPDGIEPTTSCLQSTRSPN